MENKALSTKTEIAVRFSDIDSMNVVWHGNYIQYFEDGREAFGNKYKVNYLDFHKNGILTPIVKIKCDFKKPLLYVEKAIIETKYINSEAAKLIFEFIIYRSSNMEIVATGTSVQAFLDLNKVLILTTPPFFEKWKKKWRFIK